MQRVVGDILEIARFRTGEVVLQLRRFDALELARGAVASVAPLARGATRSSRSTRRRRRSASTATTDDWSRRSINLLSNAVKYGPSGGHILVRVRAADHEVSWAVRDEGPGIPAEEQPRLFERFFVGRNDTGYARGRPGPADRARDRPGSRRPDRRREHARVEEARSPSSCPSTGRPTATDADPRRRRRPRRRRVGSPRLHAPVARRRGPRRGIGRGGARHRRARAPGHRPARHRAAGHGRLRGARARSAASRTSRWSCSPRATTRWTR